MKNIKKFFIIYLLIQLFWGCSNSQSDYNPEQDSGNIYYGVKINGVLCGCSILSQGLIEKEGRQFLEKKNISLLNQIIFGNHLNSETRNISYINPETQKCEYSTIETNIGPFRDKFTLKIKDNEAIISSLFTRKPKKVKLPPGTILGQGELIDRLKDDFFTQQIKEKTYFLLDVVDGVVREQKFTYLGVEDIDLQGKPYKAVVLDDFTSETGINFKWWFDQSSAQLLKMEVNNRVIFKTDHRVVKKIKPVNIDNLIFTKTNVEIGDIHGITYMKLKAKIAPTGTQLTSEKLNQPGQHFTGTVKNNVVDGIFEIENKKYSGENAPAFPPDFSNDKTMSQYLQPGDLIESNDPDLIKKATEITNGSQNSWEAATRLSKWVAENIAYRVPGGITARNTYAVKSGECGAHSNLMAAFCRAVGIPARVVWGAMYIPNPMGSFGQHGWNEVYMGDAGWIPLDTTAHEIDFLDSSHIRIAEHKSITTAFNGQKIEVLDYIVNNTRMGDSPGTSHQYDKYAGTYITLDKKFKATVAENNGTLVVTPQESSSLPLDTPDSNGHWYCKIARHVFFVFRENPQGNVTNMELHQTVKAFKKSESDSYDNQTPAAIIPCLGSYYLTDSKETLTVSYKEGTLVVDNSRDKSKTKLHPLAGEEKWMDPSNKKCIYFVKDANGKTEIMNIEVIIKLKHSGS